MKDEKKLFIIIGGVLISIALVIGIYFIFFNDKVEEKQPSSNNKIEDKLIAPATNTEKLKEEMKILEITNMTEDEIIFSSNLDVKEKEKVAIWIYSEPKFLGYFEVLIEDGIKKISGLSKALENIDIEIGEHNIAITTKNGEAVGYIDVYIKEDGNFANIDSEGNITITKEVAYDEVINYKTTKQNDSNKIKGYTEVIQQGENGVKNVTYKITYDINGNELSREKLSEKTIKEPIDKIEKIGTSDFNMNKDMLREISTGPMCTELLVDEYGSKSCAEGSLQYVAIKINYTEYITSITENGKTIFSGLLKTTGSDGINLIANYKGTKYYFYKSGGGEMYELLNEKTCSKYGLKCGKW